MLLFGNEGSEAVCVDVTVPGMRLPLFLDLWQGMCYCVEGEAETFTLFLQPGETGRVTEGEGTADWLCGDAAGLFAGQDDGRQKYAECRKADWYLAEYPDWTDRFSLVEKSDNAAVYELNYTAEDGTEALRFSVRAEEMVECYCNDRFVDVSFCGQHRFALDTLQKGQNKIRLVITGNAANIYENAGIAYGLAENPRA